MIAKLDVRSGWQKQIFVSIIYHKFVFILYLTFLAQTQSYLPFHCRLAFFYLFHMNTYEYKIDSYVQYVNGLYFSNRIIIFIPLGSHNFTSIAANTTIFLGLLCCRVFFFLSEIQKCAKEFQILTQIKIPRCIKSTKHGKLSFN